jgi:hypothetical protein
LTAEIKKELAEMKEKLLAEMIAAINAKDLHDKKNNAI